MFPPYKDTIQWDMVHIDHRPHLLSIFADYALACEAKAVYRAYAYHDSQADLPMGVDPGPENLWDQDLNDW